jgi:negative regulator of sigma-B (phosphoserine phosphatase)
VSALRIPGLQVGVAERALIGEARSGDVGVAIPFADGALVGAIDGLGHGDAAADASRRALEALRAEPDGALDELFDACHAALRGTRGAVMTLVSFDFATGELSWFGVGNVEARLLRADQAARAEAPMLLGGVVGQSLPGIRPSRQRLQRGDMLVLATDGVAPDFAVRRHLGSVDVIAGKILAEHARPEDDALVVVARYLGTTMPGEA